MKSSIFRSFAAAAALLGPAWQSLAQDAENPFARIGHIVVIYTENRSFDNVFGLFPGADGLGSADRFTQVDADGSALARLPPIRADESVDPRFPQTLPNAPFPIDAFAPNGEKTTDLTHDFYQEQEQIDGGRMDRFAAVSGAGGLVMGYYDGRGLAQWRLAEEFTLADHFSMRPSAAPFSTISSSSAPARPSTLRRRRASSPSSTREAFWRGRRARRRAPSTARRATARPGG